MNEKTAEGSAPAKLCPQEFISIPVDVVDDLVSIAENARAVLSDYRRSIVDGSTRAGLWIGDEASALDLATTVAAIEGLGDIIREFISVNEGYFAGSETVPESTRPFMDRVADLQQPEFLKFRSLDPKTQPDPRVGLKLLKAAEKRLRADRIVVNARELGRDVSSLEELEVRQLNIDAAQIDGDFSCLMAGNDCNDWFVE